MHVTKEGMALIKKFEGYRGKAYRCAAGVWTIGYGHTSMAGPPAVAGGLEVSREEANRILAEDVAKFAAEVARVLVVRLADHQFSAIVSFAFNVGIANFRSSSVLKAINSGDLMSVPRRLQLWNKAGGKMLPGLVRRRAAEAGMFIGKGAGTGSVRPEVAKPAGKPMRKSTTAIAAVLSMIAGMFSTVLGVAQEATTAFGATTGLILLAIMFGAAFWIIRERRLKANEEGI
jgi:lysozyme